MSNLPTYLPYAKLAQVVEDQFLLDSTEGLQVSVNGGNPHSYHDLCVTGTTLADVCEKRCGNTVVVQDRHQDFNIHIPDLVSMKYWWLKKRSDWEGTAENGVFPNSAGDVLFLCPDKLNEGVWRVVASLSKGGRIQTPWGLIENTEQKWNLAWDVAHFFSWERPPLHLERHLSVLEEQPHIILDYGKQGVKFSLYPYRKYGTLTGKLFIDLTVNP